jgi:hypothetical protein
MSKDLLKEAIADAKAVRETAIANARLALEEAFTPKLQSMLSAKLQEDDELEDEELEDEMPVNDYATEEMEDEMGADEAPVEDETDLGEMGHEEDETEEAHHEGTYSEEDEVPGEEEDEDLELEAIIRELEGEDAEEEEEVPMEGVKEDAHEEDEDEDIDLDEVIKSLSEDEHEDEAEEEEESDDLAEAYATIKSLKDTLVEVNLLNAKLLFSNKLFKGNDLSESQKMKVIETFDRASNLREVKLVYTTLSESFTSKVAARKTVTEGFASKKSNSTAPKGQIVESNGMADRMKRLAGLL